jgi:hypothetical protein
MSRRVLILGIAVVLAVGAVATYVWVGYSRAHYLLNSADEADRSLAENLDRRDVNLNEMYRVAKVWVDQLEYYPSIWIDKQEIAALRSTLKEAKHEIDQRAAAADKRKPSSDYGGWVHPSPQ